MAHDETRVHGLPRRRRWEPTRSVPGTFDGVAVVVTGGGTGLGKAIASEFARLGADLAVLSRKPEHLDAARERHRAPSAPGSRPSSATSVTRSASAPRSTASRIGSGCPACW